MLNKRLVRADLVLHLTRFEHHNLLRFSCHTFLFPVMDHPQGFLGSELAWDVQIGGLLHRRAVIFVMIMITNGQKEMPNLVTLSESRRKRRDNCTCTKDPTRTSPAGHGGPEGRGSQENNFT